MRGSWILFQLFRYLPLCSRQPQHGIIMTRQRIHQSSYPSPYVPTNLSVSQYLTRYNPDSVPPNKVILEDDWTVRAITYSSLRKEAARAAWALQQSFNLKPGDVVAISAPNSVCLMYENHTSGKEANYNKVAHVQLLHAVLWAGGTISLV